ncbi:MAG: hypothetical protein ABFD89_12610 [Bryobacteraceae bacterium]
MHKQPPIVPSAVAREYSNGLIARYGIRAAADIARCIAEQVQAAINQQKRMHPAEWCDSAAPVAQSLQPEPQPVKKSPAMPRIGG